MIIETRFGPMDESKIVKTEGGTANTVEHTTWVEYRFEGQLVHRSAHVTLKQMPVFATGEAAEVG